MEKIKCAVIGTGIFGEIHVHTYKTYDKAELVIVCDVNEERAKNISKKYDVAYTKDYKEIVQNPEIKCVSVATPDFLHKEIVIELAKAGKNILVEKPMATSVKDAEEMVETAKKYGVILMTDFHNRFNPVFVEAYEKIKNGEIGKFAMIYARLSDRIDVPLKWFSWSSKSGPHWFLFPHIVDIITWLAGKLPVEVYGIAHKGILKEKGVDTYDVVTGILNFEDFYGVVETSWIIPENWPSIVDFYLKIEGSTGRIEINFENPGFKYASDIKKTMEIPFYTGYKEIYGKPLGFAPLPIMHFIDCLYENKKPLITPEDGLNNVKIIQAIIDSIKENKPLKINF